MNDKDIRYLKGVGEKRAALFSKKGIKTIGDLLYFFPRTYEDRSKISAIAECMNGETVCVKATVEVPAQERHIRRGMTLSSMIVSDFSGVMNIMWFNNRYVKDTFHKGDEYIFYGKIEMNAGKIQMQNPIYEKESRLTGKIVPVYPLTGDLKQRTVQLVMEAALREAGTLEEYIPADIREKYAVAEINYAMRNIHFPDTFDSYNIARHRFVFEELFLLQLALLMRKDKNIAADGIVFKDAKCGKFIASLPFSLTNAQVRVIGEIEKDCSSGKMMNRLVQGDVGSGKTVVSAAAMYTAVKNGYQAALMAPTEILAHQHYDTLSEFYKNENINIVLITGSMKGKAKKEAYAKVASGEADIAIGTHALIQEDLKFANLGFVTADEQHRFGVEQRAKLSAKGKDPHMLIMSATPIPRTLALILYGDLDVSVIDELPPGRKSVKTYAVGESYRKRVYAFVEKNVKAGMQAYVVCPLIEETEKSDLKNAIDLTEKLSRSFPDIRFELMHGKMKAGEKEAIMKTFESGETDVLVSTTVIEVGVNVPNANMMVIENAERFGLSQLHQLRGRVGRGGDQAYCILITHGANDVTKKRMETMCASNDGFYISEQDLKLRGPGDFFGTRQHGLPEMKIANLFEDTDVLLNAQEAAKAVIAADPELSEEKNAALKTRCEKILSENIVMN